MASPTLITPTSTPKSLPPIKTKITTIAATLTPAANTNTNTNTTTLPRRREFLSIITASVVSSTWLVPLNPALAAADEEYVKDTEEVINKVKTAITMDKNDPNVAAAVAELRDTSNSWVAKYRREKALLGRASFRDIYSAINAVSGHYISFGPTAPIPAKRKARILEEVDTAAKALQRGR
ncbi:photosystem II repair protein PSB27-H1, chloroplastic [Gastrolobium bilobum]|uniref:photosystem II repair protein PSB27-H1, chloroplastic n=1 Tax=Gastrolobium bilobum TaxID=150636 RepID=UPI002AB1F3EC|nr:photosystem II repair protein PSB27-H1, chloroplastic [Gastrolobium bilobum]